MRLNLMDARTTDAPSAGFEEFRARYGPHERRVRSVALLYWFVASQFALSVIPLSYYIWTGEPPEERSLSFMVFLTLACVGMTALPAVAAWNLQRLNNTGRILGAITAAGSLLLIPLGTIVGAGILWILLSAKGESVFSPTYRDAIVATPDLQFRASRVVVWLVVGFTALWTVVALMLLAVPFEMDGLTRSSAEANPSSSADEGSDQKAAVPSWEEQVSTDRYFKAGSDRRLNGIDEDLIEQWKEPIDPDSAGPFKRNCLKPEVSDSESVAVRKKCDSRFNACSRMQRICAQGVLCATKRSRCIDRVWGSPDCCL